MPSRPSSAKNPPLWERARAGVRSEVVETAMRLFAEQGFEATTIGQIVEEAGVSRRSFFRYFGTKEDILLGDLMERGAKIAEALRERPADENPWTALEESFRTSMGDAPVPTEHDLLVSRLVVETPSLRAAHAAKHQRWQRDLAPVLVERLRQEPNAELAANAIVAAALACLETATQAWVASGGREDLERLYRQTVAVIRT
ncbi:TetR family transcriptional regulator [Georgenia halophila]|uniref:TetR family transcriptional regulator n=1 Tax=Georgenia halophila TaxID=620889 RepID=A0ABP8KSY2_9MICO